MTMPGLSAERVGAPLLVLSLALALRPRHGSFRFTPRAGVIFFFPCMSFSECCRLLSSPESATKSFRRVSLWHASAVLTDIQRASSLHSAGFCCPLQSTAETCEVWRQIKPLPRVQHDVLHSRCLTAQWAVLR